MHTMQSLILELVLIVAWLGLQGKCGHWKLEQTATGRNYRHSRSDGQAKPYGNIDIYAAYRARVTPYHQHNPSAVVHEPALRPTAPQLKVVRPAASPQDRPQTTAPKPIDPKNATQPKAPKPAVPAQPRPQPPAPKPIDPKNATQPKVPKPAVPAQPRPQPPSPKPIDPKNATQPKVPKPAVPVQPRPQPPAPKPPAPEPPAPKPPASKAASPPKPSAPAPTPSIPGAPNTLGSDIFTTIGQFINGMNDRIGKLEKSIQNVTDLVVKANNAKSIAGVMEPQGLPKVEKDLKTCDEYYESQIELAKNSSRTLQGIVNEAIGKYDKLLYSLLSQKKLLAEAGLISSVVGKVEISKNMTLWSWVEPHSRRSRRSGRSANKKQVAIVRRIDRALKALRT